MRNSKTKKHANHNTKHANKNHDRCFLCPTWHTNHHPATPSKPTRHPQRSKTGSHLRKIIINQTFTLALIWESVSKFQHLFANQAAAVVADVNDMKVMTTTHQETLEFRFGSPGVPSTNPQLMLHDGFVF